MPPQTRAMSKAKGKLDLDEAECRTPSRRPRGNYVSPIGGNRTEDVDESELLVFRNRSNSIDWDTLTFKPLEKVSLRKGETAEKPTLSRELGL